MQKDINQGQRQFQQSNTALLYAPPQQQNQMFIAQQRGIVPSGQRPVLSNPAPPFFVASHQQPYISQNVFHQQSGPNEVYQPFQQPNTTFIQNPQYQQTFHPSYQQYQIVQPAIQNAGYPMQQQQTRIGTAGPPMASRLSFNPTIPAVQSQQQQMYIHNQHNQVNTEQPQPHQPQTHKKSNRIKIVDPNTGEDKTDAFKKKVEKTPHPTPVVGVATATAAATAHPVVPQTEDAKAAVNAQFQAQVLAVAAKVGPSTPKPAIISEPVKQEKTEINETKHIKIEKDQEDSSKTLNEKVNIDNEKGKQIVTKPEENVGIKNSQDVLETEGMQVKEEVPTPLKEDTDENKTVQSDQSEKLIDDIASTVPDVPSNETKESSVHKQAEALIEPYQEKVAESVPEVEAIIPVNENTVETEPGHNPDTEVPPNELSEVSTDNAEAKEKSVAASDVDLTIQEDVNKSAFNTVTKKKKGKNRFKDIDSKDNDNNDMLSAFKDKPEKKEKQVETKPLEKPIEKTEALSEDATWEDKEKSIEKEVIRNEDAEETEMIPKTAETKIIKSESTPVPTEEDKLQYDRDFLLKFQFAPICKTKPAGLPNIDIVLDYAHAPTEALIPGQRISTSNDFMPTFMRSQSGGGSRSSGGGRSSGGNRRIGSSSLSTKPQKVIQAPQFEKIELKKSENAWVRPSEKAKELPEEDRELDELLRNVRSILNKLTPQKFDTLLSKMKSLKVDSLIKLQKSIDLVFEKAVSEPNFSVAYARMCRELTGAANLKQFPAGDNSDPAKSQNQMSFRKILLNKCQTEFEKEGNDEKEIQEARNKTFEKEEEKKAWIEELDYKERMNRRRMLGNIRFIGELFKLKMISETIMHNQCIVKLLRAEKQESLEDQLECLCKLLATVGKDLDHAKGKPRMDQYFTQIQKIIAKKKISSRIKFALQDVIELRQNKWIPRRDEGNPKTIDQIHEEAQRKEREQEIQRQQDKLMRKTDNRRGVGGGGGGRESPSIRGGTDGLPTPSTDGWTNVGSKSARQIAATPVDVNKFRLRKNEGEISLGPGRQGMWSRGASGGSNRSGSNTPTSEVEQRTNRYDILTDSSVSHSTFDNKGRASGSKQSNPRRGTPPFGSSRKGDDRSAALRAVKDMTGGRSSRNQSPARGTNDSARSTPPSGTHTPPVPSETPVQNEVSEDSMSKKTKSTIEEYVSCNDKSEALLCLKELNSPSMHYVFVREAVSIVTEKRPEHRRMVGTLFHHLLNENVLTLDQITKGLSEIMEFASDIAVDVPLVYKYLGEVLGPIVYDGALGLDKLTNILEPLISINKAALVMSETINVAVDQAGSKGSIAALWQASGMSWERLLPKGSDAQDLIKRMDFLATPARSVHTSQIQEELNQLLKDRSEKVAPSVISYIEANVSSDRHSKLEFIHMLTRLVCNSVIIEKDGCSCDRNALALRKNILERFINSKKELELQALYAVQQVVCDLDHPKDLLKNLFEELYMCEVINEDTFYTWAESKDYPDGKGMALTSVKGFLNWLQKAEEESNEEETLSSTRANNATTN